MERSLGSRVGAAVIVTGLALAAASCGKKSSTSTTAPAASTKATTSGGPSWPGALAAKEGKGWFEITTGGSGQSAPLSNTQCALWTLFYEGQEKDSGVTRAFSDEWPREGVTLTVDGKPIVVEALHVRWETPPSLTKDYVAGDPIVPDKAKEMLVAKTWMNKQSETLPTKVTATERCLTPSTKYRAELRKTVSPSMGDGKQYALGGGAGGGENVSYTLAIAPAP